MANEAIARDARRARQPRRWLWGVVAGVLVLVVAAFGFALTRPSGAVGSAALGTPVPGLSLPSTAGHPISLTDYRGRQVVLYFYEGST